MNYDRCLLRLENRVYGMLYTPQEAGPRSRVGIVLMHSDGDYLEFIPASALAERGYTVLAANVSDNRRPLDEKLPDVKIAVQALRQKSGIEKVVLLGHSGGATLMSAYQAAAENGVQIFRDPGRVIPMADIGELPAADAVMLLDPNFGNGAMTLLSLDPAITDESTGMFRDPELDLFNPKNGYSPEGCHYGEAFVHRFVQAQGQRMNRLIRHAQERIALIESGKGRYIDDEPFCIPGASQIGPNNKLFPQMVNYFSHTRDSHDHIHADGTVTRETVVCVRSARKPLNSADRMGFGGLNTTVRNFLRSSAVRVFDDFHYDETTLYGVDWDSSFCCTTGNVRHISVPMLLMGMTGGYEYIAAEHAWREAVCCTDKTCTFVEGANHVFRPTDEKYGDTVGRCFDYVDRWLTAHVL